MESKESVELSGSPIFSMTIFKSLEESKQQRRLLLRRRFLSFLLVGTAGYVGYRWWRSRPQALSQRDTSYLTANRDFYSVSIRPGFRPEVTREAWRLRTEGPGGTREYRADELRTPRTRIDVRTLCCVGNPVGGTAIGTAEWTVTPLAEFLRPVAGRAGTDAMVTFFALDGFYSSVPLWVALDPGTVLAFEMNGVELPAAHGFPVRVLIPDRYGMKQPRWLERIVVQEEGSGYWESRGWCSECRVRMMSRIDSAHPTGRDWTLRGIAFCGGTAVGAVEISDDGGDRWNTAELLDPALPNAWIRWQYRWRPDDNGDHVLSVRVVDRAGNRQVESDSGAWPSGATGLHRVIVRVPAG